MALDLRTPAADDLPELVRVLGEWQDESAPFQLHPGDLGWHQQAGPDSTARALRTWHHDGALVAIGMLDARRLIRLTTAPGTSRDDALADLLAADLDDPERGVLPAGEVSIEAPSGARLHESLAERGWAPGERWAPLRRDLTAPVEPVALRIVEVGPEQIEDRVAVHRSAFDSTKLTRERWLSVTASAAHRQARSLLGYDEGGRAVAMATVWSAGPGRPGIIEPLGVHQDHRGRGHGRAITHAAAAALQAMGASSMQVATPSANTRGVAAYVSAGMQPLPERRDSTRPA